MPQTDGGKPAIGRDGAMARLRRLAGDGLQPLYAVKVGWAATVARRPQMAARAGGCWLRARCSGWLAAEIDDRRHWLLAPACIGAGILWFFAGPGPGKVGLAFVALLALVVASLTRTQSLAKLSLLGLALVVSGFAAAALRVAMAPTSTMGGVMHGGVIGLVVQVEQRPQGAQLLLAPSVLPDARRGKDIALVRLAVPSPRPNAEPGTVVARAVLPGDVVAVRARLTAPPDPYMFGGYDFARSAWFRGIGATGTAHHAPIVVTDAREADFPVAVRWAAWVDRQRVALTGRIAGAWGGEAGAVAAALVTGKRGQISDEANEALRAAGIYHILSISGLHMALAAAMLFWTSRALLALTPWCALHLPVRKLAASLAIAGSLAYCVFTGADVATVRALIMIAALLGAILIDRPALSLHNLALAAVLLLLWQPESLLTPGFQMSFAAVAALIIAFGARGGDVEPQSDRAFWLQRWIWRPLRATLVATAVCEIATAPFSIWHFQHIYPLGLLGNAMTLPFLSLAVMPAAMLGMALAPFGADWPVWWLMGAATEPVLWVSEWIAATPGAVKLVAASGDTSLLLIALAWLWFVACRTPLRWFAMAPASAGLLLAVANTPPDVMVDRNGRGALVRLDDAHGEVQLALLGRVSPFVARQWYALHGLAMPHGARSRPDTGNCDANACAVRRNDGGLVVWARRTEAMQGDCRHIDVLISSLPAPGPCRPALLLDGPALVRSGAVSVWLNDGDIALRAVRRPGESWPWRRVLPVLWPAPTPRRPTTADPMTIGPTEPAPPAQPGVHGAPSHPQMSDPAEGQSISHAPGSWQRRPALNQPDPPRLESQIGAPQQIGQNTATAITHQP